MDSKKLNTRINVYLAVNETTKDALAKELGMTRQTLHNKISGVSEFKLSEAVQLSKLLDCDVDELMEKPAVTK